jgi:hypothetical protein
LHEDAIRDRLARTEGRPTGAVEARHRRPELIRERKEAALGPHDGA